MKSEEAGDYKPPSEREVARRAFERSCDGGSPRGHKVIFLNTRTLPQSPNGDSSLPEGASILAQIHKQIEMQNAELRVKRIRC